MSPRQTAHLFSIALLFIGFFCVPQNIFAADVVLNEFLVDPTNGQWVELYNTSSNSVDISGWYIDDSGGSEKFTIPTGTTIAPQELKVFESNSFNLNKSSSDTVQLLNGGVVIDSYLYDTGPGANASYGRVSDGIGNWVIFNAPTKGSTNNTAVAAPTITPTSIPPTATTVPTPTLKLTATPKPPTPTVTPKPSATPKPTAISASATLKPTATSVPTIKQSVPNQSNTLSVSNSTSGLTTSLSQKKLISSSSGVVLSASVSATPKPIPHKSSSVRVKSATTESIVPKLALLSGICIIIGCVLFTVRGRIRKLLWNKLPW